MDASLAQRIADVLSSRSDVMAVYLFGSTARGTARAGSDIDVAVLFDLAPLRTLSGPRLVVEGELERSLGTPVDLVVLNDAPVDLRARAAGTTDPALVAKKPALIESCVSDHLGDLEAFVGAVRRRLRGDTNL